MEWNDEGDERVRRKSALWPLTAYQRANYIWCIDLGLQSITCLPTSMFAHQTIYLRISYPDQNHTTVLYRESPSGLIHPILYNHPQLSKIVVALATRSTQAAGPLGRQLTMGLATLWKAPNRTNCVLSGATLARFEGVLHMRDH
jgi:hypothetical protein